MFRSTNPQTSLLESRFLLPAKKRERLERSWAEVFRTKILPLIDEEAFRDCFCEDNGRPNRSIRLLVGLHILKEADDLTDEQVLDALEFNLQWQHALGVEPADAHIAARTLFHFRDRMMGNERAKAVFQQVTDAMMRMDGLSSARQRLDSTHVISNIAVLTRLGLFTETITDFLREVRKEAAEKLGKIDAALTNRYLEREGYFADATREQAQRRLPLVAQDLYALVRAFEADPIVKEFPSYALIVRLLDEQCTVMGPTEGVALPPVTLKGPKEIGGDSLRSPHDPDATYGHKGKGYEAQIAETCVADNPYQVITGIGLTDACGSDQKATVPMVEQLAADGHKPDVLLADTGYGSGENIVECAEMGVELLAPVQDPGAPPRPDPWLPRATPGAAPVTPVPEAAPEVEAPPEAPPVLQPVRPSVALALDGFRFDRAFSEVVRCPAGVEPIEQEMSDSAFYATFPGSACAACPMAAECPARRIAGSEDRVLRFRDSAAATATRQREQREPAFRDAHRLRSGIESTNAEIKGRHGAGALRVRRRPRVELAMTLKALALNVKRAVRHHVDVLRLAMTDAESSGMAIA